MSQSQPRTAREEWGSRFGFLMAMLGAMVGAGNIWRMPFTTGQNGGGAFLVAYVLLLYLIAVPGLMAETMIGRFSQQGVIGTFEQFFSSRAGKALGLVVLVVNVALMSYYVPIIGWTLYYAIHSLLFTFSSAGFQPQAFWASFSGSPLLVIGMHTLSAAVIAGVLVFGIRKGIERVVKWLMPILVVALVAIAARGLTLSGGTRALEFVFTPRWRFLTQPDVWIAALGQALFSTGLGWGIALTYGSYLNEYDDVPLGGGVFTAVGNTSIGLLAVFATFPVVFAFGIDPAAGSDLAFIALVQVFPRLPGGAFWAIAFFVSFFFATLTSGLGITEVGVTTVSEQTDLGRTGSVLAVVGAIWLFGLPSAYSSTFLGWMNFIFGNWGLPLATLAIIVLVGWQFGPSRARAIDLNRFAGITVGAWWDPIVKYVIPAVMVVIMGAAVVGSVLEGDALRMVVGLAVMTAIVVGCVLAMRQFGSRPEATPTPVEGGDD